MSDDESIDMRASISMLGPQSKAVAWRRPYRTSLLPFFFPLRLGLVRLISNANCAKTGRPHMAYLKSRIDQMLAKATAKPSGTHFRVHSRAVLS